MKILDPFCSLLLENPTLYRKIVEKYGDSSKIPTASEQKKLAGSRKLIRLLRRRATLGTVEKRYAVQRHLQPRSRSLTSGRS